MRLPSKPCFLSFPRFVFHSAILCSFTHANAQLSDRIINNDLLRYLARAQSDADAHIRTNTCILIGKLAPSLGPTTRRKVLVPAFTRAIKDPFVPARLAGVMSFMGAVECFDPEELASRVVPAVAAVMIDPEK